MLAVEHANGMAPEIPVLMMRNPARTLPLAYLLGFLGLRVAVFLWSTALLGCLFLSVHLVRLSTVPCRIAFTGWCFPFTPALMCLVMDQTALYALLGLVLFLYFHSSRPFAAGLSLWLCALKPHLLLAFFAAMAVWIVVSRSYKALAGAITSVAVKATAATYLIDPQAWPDYLNMMHASNIDKEFIPCLSDALRIWVRPQAFWLQYLPRRPRLRLGHPLLLEAPQYMELAGQ